MSTTCNTCTRKVVLTNAAEGKEMAIGLVDSIAIGAIIGSLIALVPDWINSLQMWWAVKIGDIRYWIKYFRYWRKYSRHDRN